MTYTWQNQAPVSIKSFLTIEYLLKECITKEVPRVSFLRTVIMSRGNSCELKPKKKTFFSCVNEQIHISLEKFSKCINLEWNFEILTCASQRRLLELLSYGEYDQLFISVICFLKRTRLPFHRFQFFIYFLSFRKTSTYIIFLLLNNNDHSNSVLNAE